MIRQILMKVMAVRVCNFTDLVAMIDAQLQISRDAVSSVNETIMTYSRVVRGRAEFVEAQEQRCVLIRTAFDTAELGDASAVSQLQESLADETTQFARLREQFRVGCAALSQEYEATVSTTTLQMSQDAEGGRYSKFGAAAHIMMETHRKYAEDLVALAQPVKQYMDQVNREGDLRDREAVVFIPMVRVLLEKLGIADAELKIDDESGGDAGDEGPVSAPARIVKMYGRHPLSERIAFDLSRLPIATLESTMNMMVGLIRNEFADSVAGRAERTSTLQKLVDSLGLLELKDHESAEAMANYALVAEKLGQGAGSMSAPRPQLDRLQSRGVSNWHLKLGPVFTDSALVDGVSIEGVAYTAVEVRDLRVEVARFAQDVKSGMLEVRGLRSDLGERLSAVEAELRQLPGHTVEWVEAELRRALSSADGGEARQEMLKGMLADIQGQEQALAELMKEITILSESGSAAGQSRTVLEAQVKEAVHRIIATERVLSEQGAVLAKLDQAYEMDAEEKRDWTLFLETLDANPKQDAFFVELSRRLGAILRSWEVMPSDRLTKEASTRGKVAAGANQVVGLVSSSLGGLGLPLQLMLSAYGKYDSYKQGQRDASVSSSRAFVMSDKMAEARQIAKVLTREFGDGLNGLKTVGKGKEMGHKVVKAMIQFMEKDGLVAGERLEIQLLRVGRVRLEELLSGSESSSVSARRELGRLREDQEQQAAGTELQLSALAKRAGNQGDLLAATREENRQLSQRVDDLARELAALKSQLA